jgi:putative DNA primase/helicase
MWWIYWKPGDQMNNLMEWMKVHVRDGNLPEPSTDITAKKPRNTRQRPAQTEPEPTHVEAEPGKDLQLARDGELLPLRLNDTPVVGALMQNPTEDNVALAFSERNIGKYIYMFGRDSWFQWDRRRWNEDRLRTVYEELRSLARAYNPEGKVTPAKHSFVNGCLNFAKSDPSFSRLADDFDNDNYLFNCPDGTYNLLTDKCHDHNPDDHITMMAAVSPTSQGGVLFLKFLDEVFDGDKELIDWVQTALGSCLSGAIEDHWLMFWIGGGRNGKNTLGDLVLMVLGEYAKVIPSDTLMSKKNAEHKTEIVNLKGCRLAVASETEEGDFWAESKLKQLTGDAELSGRFMHKDFIHFKRTHKHLIYGNHRPQLRSLDKAMRSRLKVVPFNVSFAGREDATLPQKLWNEAGFVLNWLMEGHRTWLNQGRILGDCKAVRDEIEDYFSMQLTVENWIAENCDRTDEDRPNCGWLKTSDLYANFGDWCKDGGAGVPSVNRFGEKLKSLGFKRVKSNGNRYVGIALKYQ